MITASVILCTRDPHPGRLARTLAALAAQSLPASEWELLLVDNGSTPSLDARALPPPCPAPANLRVVPEPRPGLTPARLRGIAEARGEVLVFVDDDNVLAPDFLATALDCFRRSPSLGVAGGPVRPEFEAPPPDWTKEFHGLLALHDHGPEPRLAPGGPDAAWPGFAPVGAGLCIRAVFARRYAEALRDDPRRAALDRRAGQLTSGGDNDIVFTALRAGADVGYFPGLSLLHLIPPARLAPEYLARLNRAIQRSWVRVLDLHGLRPWRAIPKPTLPLRVARAWLRDRPWRSDADRVRHAGVVGRLEGQADLSNKP